MSGNIVRPSWRRAVRLLSLCLFVPALAACMQIGPGDTEEERVLRIAYLSGDSSYDDYMRTQYTDLFEFTHSNIEIELVPAVDWSKRRFEVPKEGEPYREPNYIEEMKKLVEGDNPPDVILLHSLEDLAALVKENMLQSLESYVQDDEFDLEGFVPAVINGLREVGNNQLYALAPTFSTSALIYNKTIFEQRGVDYPTDQMTWEQTFNLARQVAHGEGEERVYGFGFVRYFYDDLFWGMEMYAAPLDLNIVDENAEKMLVNSESWKRVFQSLVDLKLEKIMPEPPQYDQGGTGPVNPFEGDAFLSGRLAMSVISYNQLHEIISANQNAANVEGFTPVQWDVVTLPVHPEAPGVGGFIQMDPIIGIAANAQNPEDAWEFVKFVNSEDWAELKSRSMTMMTSREAYIKPLYGLDYNISAFYQLTPVLGSYDPGMDPALRDNMWQLQNIGQMKIMEVVNGDKTVEQALQEWENEGNMILQQIRENPDGFTNF